MVTVKITIEFERDGEKQQHELTRDEAETLYAELGRALGKAPMPLGVPWTVPWVPNIPCGTGDPLPPSPYRITCNTEAA